VPTKRPFLVRPEEWRRQVCICCMKKTVFGLGYVSDPLPVPQSIKYNRLRYPYSDSLIIPSRHLGLDIAYREQQNTPRRTAIEVRVRNSGARRFGPGGLRWEKRSAAVHPGLALGVRPSPEGETK
jgi:hypothetical protein